MINAYISERGGWLVVEDEQPDGLSTRQLYPIGRISLFLTTKVTDTAVRRLYLVHETTRVFVMANTKGYEGFGNTFQGADAPEDVYEAIRDRL